MNKSLKLNLLIMPIFLCFISLVAYKNNINSFNQAQAITQIIKIHPEFPANPNDTITKDIEVRGGPNVLIATAKVKFTTKVEASDKNSYIITLTKDWGITIRGTYIKSFWEYKVTPSSTTLIESINNDYLPMTIK